MIFQETYKKKQLFTSYFVFVCNGMLALSIGSLLPFIADARGLSYEVSGLLVSLHSVGNFLSSFLMGVVIAIDLCCILALVTYVKKLK